MPSPVTDADAAVLDNILKGDLITISRNHTAGLFPECADFLLSIVKFPGDPGFSNQFLSYKVFIDYFVRAQYSPISYLSKEDQDQYSRAFNSKTCYGFDSTLKSKKQKQLEHDVNPPSPSQLEPEPIDCCIPCSCISLSGMRRVVTFDPNYTGYNASSGLSSSIWGTTPVSPNPNTTVNFNPFGLEDLFFADTLTVYWLDQMGIWEIIDAMIKDYFHYGQKPFQIGRLSGLVLETMGRLQKKGLNPSKIDLEGLYGRILGWWKPPNPRQLTDAVTNFGFNTLFHKLIVQMLHLIAQEEIIDAVTQAATAPPVAHEVALTDTLALMKETMRVFRYNINWHTTLNALVWFTAGLAVLEQNRDPYGIPETHSSPAQYIEDAYSIWVQKQCLTTPMHTNRFLTYSRLHESARRLLLSIEVLDITNPRNVRVFAFLEAGTVKEYSNTFKILTGIDLGAVSYRADGGLKVPQQI
jgi:hypothetical protein